MIKYYSDRKLTSSSITPSVSTHQKRKKKNYEFVHALKDMQYTDGRTDRRGRVDGPRGTVESLPPFGDACCTERRNLTGLLMFHILRHITQFEYYITVINIKLNLS